MDSRARDKVKKGWIPRSFMRVGEANVINEPLVAGEKIIIRPLHTKLGLIKQFLKAMPVTRYCFNYIFTALSALTINPNYPTVYKSKPIFKERFLPSKQI